MTDDSTPAKVRLSDWLGRCDAAHVCDCQEAARQCERIHDWVTYNPLTNTYDTLDGTSVAAELVDSVQCLADVLHIAQIRARQRAARDAMIAVRSAGVSTNQPQEDPTRTQQDSASAMSLRSPSA